MKKKNVLLTILLFSVCVLIGLHLTVLYNKHPVSAATDSTDDSTDSNIPKKPSAVTRKDSVRKSYTGLKKVHGKLYYYIKGKPYCNGLKTIKAKDKRYYYFFQKNGEAYTKGFKTVQIDGNKYYFYFQKNGKALTETLKAVSLNKKKYYFYFQKNGKALTDHWKKINDNKYYFEANGKASTGTKVVSHYLCHFDDKGVLYRQIDIDKKMVALTYDDGPSINTPRILKTLKENDSVATFFVVGSRVKTYADALKSEYKMHCQIGNHSYNHTILTKVDADTIKKEIKSTNDAVKKIIKTSPIVMRPPGGAVDDEVKENVKMPMIIWSLDTLDWKTRNADSTKKAVLDNIKDGDIVLMHDLYDATATASETIIPELVERGYQLVTISELAQCRDVKLKNGKSYFSFKKK